MKTKIGILFLAVCATFFNLQAQQRVVTTTRATSYDISDNLDLDAVASIFGESENLEDFERRLNDPDIRISNLDLNGDGYIDYLRVLENSSDRNSLIVIQAVLDEDVFQDVATIEIERVPNGNHRIQIVGNDYIYGSNYIIEPIFVHTPLIFSFFWSPRYITWHSPYYWDYYPRWYRYYRPYSPFKYHRHVHVHINRDITYHRANSRNIHYSGDNYNHIRRNDYASRHPDRSFVNRNKGINNHQELRERRPDSPVNYQRKSDSQRSNSRQVQEKRRPDFESGQRNKEEYRRPARTNQSGSGQIRTRENSPVKPSSNKARIQQNQDSRERPTGRPAVSKSQSTNKQAPGRTSNRVEPSRKSKAPTVKSGTRTNQPKSNNAVRSVQKTEKKAESKKESTERRRTR